MTWNPQHIFFILIFCQVILEVGLETMGATMGQLQKDSRSNQPKACHENLHKHQ